jgi:ElaA protein
MSKNAIPDIRFELKSFKALSAEELYNILQLRAEVFIVEQNCPYQDVDGKDLKSHHLMGYDKNNKLIVYSRLIPAGISYDETSIGRVVSSPSVRGSGAGRVLMKEALTSMEKLFGKVPVRIGAQLYLKKFYEEFGFITEGETYLEDGIPHVIMLRK